MAEYDFSNIDFSPFIRPSYAKKSMGELIKQATENDKFAAFELGARYRRNGDTQNAYKYFTIAAQLGDEDAPLEVALILDRQGRYKEAAPFFEMSIERKDDARAHTILGEYYVRGEVGGLFRSKRDKDAFQHFLIAAKKGYPRAQYLTALSYAEALGTSQSIFDYIFWLRCAQLNGFPDAIKRVKTMNKQQYELFWENNLKAVDRKISQHEEYIEEYFRQQADKKI